MIDRLHELLEKYRVWPALAVLVLGALILGAIMVVW